MKMFYLLLHIRVLLLCFNLCFCTYCFPLYGMYKENAMTDFNRVLNEIEIIPESSGESSGEDFVYIHEQDGPELHNATDYGESIQTDSEGVTIAMKYFEKYPLNGINEYHFEKDLDGDVQLHNLLVQDVTLFQNKYKKFGLNVTGSLDQRTIKLMTTPRCGNLDNIIYTQQRYVHEGGRLPQQYITYKITSYSTAKIHRIRPEVINEEIEYAFKVWESVTNLNFTNSNTPDIDIKFVPTYVNHGDALPFDGPEGTLAHGFYPNNPEPIRSDIHFDDAEKWTAHSYLNKNLFQIAAHEIGHVLGLGHSNDPKSLMAPFYSGYKNSRNILSSDDILGIQALYGIKFIKPKPAVPDKDKSNSNLHCGHQKNGECGPWLESSSANFRYFLTFKFYLFLVICLIIFI